MSSSALLSQQWDAQSCCVLPAGFSASLYSLPPVLQCLMLCSSLSSSRLFYYFFCKYTDCEYCKCSALIFNRKLLWAFGISDQAISRCKVCVTCYCIHIQKLLRHSLITLFIFLHVFPMGMNHDRFPHKEHFPQRAPSV